jgi:rare lipoprotein A
MFPESQWGVAASPRLVDPDRPIPKGGGIYKVGTPYQVGGRWYAPREQPEYDRVGIASWYGADFHARRTANGEIYDMNALTAAHPTLPLPSYAYVTNLANGRTILVRVNDRGPYVADRIIDLSHASARELALARGGTGRVRVRYAGPAPIDGSDYRERRFLASRPWRNRYAAEGGEAMRAVSAREAEASDAREREIVLGRGPASRYADARGNTWTSPDRPRGSSSWSPAAYRAGLAR